MVLLLSILIQLVLYILLVPYSSFQAHVIHVVLLHVVDCFLIIIVKGYFGLPRTFCLGDLLDSLGVDLMGVLLHSAVCFILHLPQ